MVASAYAFGGRRPLFLRSGFGLPPVALDGVQMTYPNAAIAGASSLQVPLCPCCGAEKTSLSFEKGGCCYYGCRDCGVTFIFPWPDDEALQKLYADYGRRYYSTDGLKDFLLSPKHYHREIGLLVRVTRVGELLDVGCSVGGFVRAAGDLGYAAQGIDISPTSVLVGQQAGLKIRSGDFLVADFPAKFDVVTMWATLEHLPDPNRYVKRARELLRPGGFLLASVPNFSGITQRLAGKRDRYVGTDHLNYWTARGFAAYMTRSGFHVERTMTFGFNPITLAQDWINRQAPPACEQMAVEQKRSASIKDTWIGYAHHTVERMLDLGRLGDCVAVAARVPDESERSRKSSEIAER